MQTAISMMASGTMAIVTALERCSMQTAIIIKASGMIAIVTELERCPMQTAISMKASGPMIRCMGKASTMTKQMVLLSKEPL